MPLSEQFELLEELGHDPLLLERSGMSLRLVPGTDGAFHADGSCRRVGSPGRVRWVALKSLRMVGCESCIPSRLPPGRPGGPQEVLSWLCAVSLMAGQLRDATSSELPLGSRRAIVDSVRAVFDGLPTPRLLEDAAAAFSARVDVAASRLQVAASSLPSRERLLRRSAARVVAQHGQEVLFSEPYRSLLGAGSSPEYAYAIGDTWRECFTDGKSPAERLATVLKSSDVILSSPVSFRQVADLSLPADLPAGTPVGEALAAAWRSERARVVGELLSGWDAQAEGLLAAPPTAVAGFVESRSRLEAELVELLMAFPVQSRDGAHVVLAPAAVCSLFEMYGFVPLPVGGLSLEEMHVAAESFLVLWSSEPSSALNSPLAAWDAATALLV